MIHHGPTRQPRGARGGVTIIVSGTLAEGGKKEGTHLRKVEKL